MKKLFFAAVFMAALFTTAQAQTISKAETKPMTKEEKTAAKEKKEADLVAAFTKAGLTAEEQKKCRAILDDSNEKTKPFKTEVSSDAEAVAKKEKLDAIYKERNDNLKAAIGEAKYKLFKAAQKEQKEQKEVTAQ